MATREEAQALDRSDPLRRFREEFDLPEGIIYLDGNSLGPPPRRALERLDRAARREWRQGLVQSWNDAGWFDLARRAGAKVARLIGAADDDVIICDSVSVNIFKLAAALIAARPGANLAVEAGEFPTDQYVLESAARLTGVALQRVAAGATPPSSVIVRSLVHYRTAEVRDMAQMEKEARAVGCDVIWDLSHATGVADFNVRAAGARFAVGCGYKFLNGGPGAPAFLYVARESALQLASPVCGWMGHAAPFDFTSAYTPADGVGRFASGTPPILSLSALDAALDLFDGLDMRLLEAKARALGDLFLAATRDVATPLASPQRRGGHVCLASEDGYSIMQALIGRGVIGDFRAPNLMRFGFSPLVNSFDEVWRASEVLRDVLAAEDWRRPEFRRRGLVT